MKVYLLHRDRDFDLAAGQRFVTIVLSKVGCDLGGNSFLAGVNLPNDFDKFFWRHAFEDISAGSGFKGTLDFHVTSKGGQDDDASLRKFRSNRNHGVDATHVG